MKKFVLLLISSLLLAACASTDRNKEAKPDYYGDYVNKHQIKSQKQIVGFRMRDWKELDDKHLIISKSAKRNYLITLKGSCRELRYTQTIGIKNNGNVLSAGFDAIVLPEDRGLHCFIKTIHKLTKEQEKEVLLLGQENS